MPPTPGLNNNAYTNIMAVWVLCRVQEVLNLLPDIRRAELMTRLQLSADEIARWDDISRKNVCAVSWRRDHQPVRGLRTVSRAGLGELPHAVRQHPAPRTDSRSGE